MNTIFCSLIFSCNLDYNTKRYVVFFLGSKKVQNTKQTNIIIIILTALMIINEYVSVISHG